jgi:hypothetical protein
MTFFEILLLIFVAFLCVFAVVDRICKCREERFKHEKIANMFDSAWEAYLDEQSRNAEAETGNREE